MTKTRSTKRALVLSALAIVMCISMLIGSTYAWFTDTVTSGNNKIVSGNLDVVLEYKTADMTDWVEVDADTKIFDENALYEPGYTEVVFLRVSNAGSLALKYRMAVNIVSETPAINVYDEEFKLSDYLMIGSYFTNEYSGVDNWSALIPYLFANREDARKQVAANAAKLSEFGGIFSDDQVVLPGDNTAMIGAVVLYMPETVGNEANYKTGTAAPEINLGINLLATQYTHEEDSFGPDYDEDATYPVVVATAEELKEALANGGVVTLADNITITEQLSIAKDVTIDLNGFDLDASANTSRPFAINNEADLIINAKGSTVAVGSYGLVDLKADFSGTVTINGGTFTGNTDNGSFVKVRGNNGAVINLNNVTVVDDSTNGGSIFNGVGSENVEINVTGCDLTSYAGFSSFEKATFKDTTLNVSWYGIYNSNSDDVVIDNCVINVEGDCTASEQGNAPAAAIAVSSNKNFKVTNSDLISNADAVAVYTSGGSVELVDCDVTGTYGIYHGGYDNRTFKIIVDGAVADATCHGTVATGTDCAHCD